MFKYLNKTKIIGFIFIVCLSSCGIYYKPMTYQQSSQIKRGLTPQEVIAIRGVPSSQKTITKGQLTSEGPWQCLSFCYNLTNGNFDEFQFVITNNYTKLTTWDTNCNSWQCGCSFK
jgi:hypothetical protein